MLEVWSVGVAHNAQCSELQTIDVKIKILVNIAEGFTDKFKFLLPLLYFSVLTYLLNFH